MTYIQNHRNRTSAGVRVVLGAAIFVVIVIGIRFLLPNTFVGFFTAIARPFWRIEFSLASGQLNSAETLLGRNQELLRKLSEADARLHAMSSVIAENQDLKSLLGRASTTDCILAAVLKKPPLSPYDELILDAGTDMGFSVGNIVYAPGNIPIGEINQVLSHSSNVLLFTSSGQKYDVLIGKSNIPATAIGKGGGQYSAELPRMANVAEGDFVSISSVKSNLYGIVNAVISNASEPFETVLFSSPLNIYELRWVYVDKRS